MFPLLSVAKIALVKSFHQLQFYEFNIRGVSSSGDESWWEAKTSCRGPVCTLSGALSPDCSHSTDVCGSKKSVNSLHRSVFYLT